MFFAQITTFLIAMMYSDQNAVLKWTRKYPQKNVRTTGGYMTDAFQESTDEPIIRSKKLSLPITEEGSIDWENASEKHKKIFIQAIKADPNGILQNIQEEASSPAPDSGIADATVLVAANAILGIEAIGFTTIGTRFAPVLSNLHPVVAIQACTVTAEEMAPVMPECKEILKDLLPPDVLKYQKFAVVAEHMAKLSMVKFKACVDLAMEIEKRKNNPAYNKVNGHAPTTIDAQS